MVSKKFASDLEDYIGLINMRLCDISIDIQELSKVLIKLGDEISQIKEKKWNYEIRKLERCGKT